MLKRIHSRPAVRRLGVFTAGLMAAAAFASTLPASLPVASAASGQVYWGAYLDGAPQSQTVINSFEADAGKRMSLEMFGVPWQMNGVDLPFPTDELNTIRSRGTIPVLDWGSDNLG